MSSQICYHLTELQQNCSSEVLNLMVDSLCLRTGILKFFELRTS